MNNPTAPKPLQRPSMSRVVAIDAFRGYILLLYCAVDAFLPLLRTLPASTARDVVVRQLSHSEWQGWTYYDLGFPAFIMLLAMSMPLSLERRRAHGSTTRSLLWHVIVRSFALYILGTLFHGGLSVPLSEVRFTRVFHRLAIAIFLSGAAELLLSSRGKLLMLMFTLGGYWALMELVPAPHHPPGDYTATGNLNHYVDRVVLGAETYFFLSTLGVFATCLCGLLAGRLLLLPLSWRQRFGWYMGSGLVMMNLAFVWHAVCPINKHIWTPSFVLLSSGAMNLNFGLCYAVTDGFRWRRWAAPLCVVGRHPLFTYVAWGLLPFGRYANLLAGQGLTPLLGAAQPFVQATGQVLLLWCLVYWFDRQRTRSDSSS